MRRRAIRIPVVVAVATCSCLAGFAGGALAAFTASVQAQQTVGTVTVGSATAATATVTASTPTACTSVTVGWSRASGANSYRIEAREDGGAWTTVATVGDVTSWADASTRTNIIAAWRVHARHATSGWEGPAPAQTADVACGVPPVKDLVATNPCSSTTLSWTAPGGGVNTYDVQRRVSGGAWSVIATDHGTASFADATQHAIGALVEYQVRPGVGTTTNGPWSDLASIGSWEPFRVRSITFTSTTGTVGSLNAGDGVSVAFSKPVQADSIATHVMRVVGGGANAGLYLATSTNSTNGIGRSAFAGFGTNGNYAGTGGWADAGATYQWTSTSTGTTMTAALNNEAFTVGTGPKCAADASGIVAAGTTTSSGRW